MSNARCDPNHAVEFFWGVIGPIPGGQVYLAIVSRIVSVDKLCVHQTDERLKEAGIQSPWCHQ